MRDTSRFRLPRSAASWRPPTTRDAPPPSVTSRPRGSTRWSAKSARCRRSRASLPSWCGKSKPPGAPRREFCRIWVAPLAPNLDGSPWLGSATSSTLAGPGIVAVGPRRAVDRVLQHAGNRIVVLRRRDHDGVGGTDGALQLANGVRGRTFVVLVVQGQAADIEGLEGNACGNQTLGRAQRGAIEGTAAQAARDTKKLERVIHRVRPPVRESMLLKLQAPCPRAGRPSARPDAVQVDFLPARVGGL